MPNPWNIIGWLLLFCILVVVLAGVSHVLEAGRVSVMNGPPPRAARPAGDRAAAS